MADDLTAEHLRNLGRQGPMVYVSRRRLFQAADRIEALEAERDAALADVAKLREALERVVHDAREWEGDTLIPFDHLTHASAVLADPEEAKGNAD